MDEKKLANQALALLQRAQLTGAEVGAWVEVHNWLMSIRDGKPREEPEDAELPLDMRTVTNKVVTRTS